MRPIWTAEEARESDALMVERAEVPSLLLMENAGWGAFHVAARMVPDARHVVVACGPGQNGGDGWVVARLFRTLTSSDVTVVTVGDVEALGGDARTEMNAFRQLFGQPVAAETMDAEGIHSLCSGASLLVDALFGTGLSRDIEGAAARLVQGMNAAPSPVLALDLPSGIDADKGTPRGEYVRATRTVTFGAEKRGLRASAGLTAAGTIDVAALGFPNGPATASLIERHDLRAPTRARDAHKGSAGRVGILAGSPGMGGAAALCAHAAFRGGAGLVRLWTESDQNYAMRELMVEPLDIDAALLGLGEMHAAAIGPGLRLDLADSIRRLVVESSVPAVLDAGALGCFAAEPELLRSRPRLVLTPHPGEAARLLATDVANVQSDRYRAAQELADGTGQVVVLKGAFSLVASPGQALRVCPFGSPVLGTAGSGDVLAGVIAALLVHMDPAEAAMMGVAFHALAGEKLGDRRGVLASEIADTIPLVMGEI